MKINLIKAPTAQLMQENATFKVFLAGSCNSDIDWRKDVVDSLLNVTLTEGSITLFDPCIGDCDCLDDNKFINQIKWEERAKDASDIIIVNILEDFDDFDIMLGLERIYKIIVFCTESHPMFRRLNALHELHGFELHKSNSVEVIKETIVNKFVKEFPQRIPLADFCKYRATCCCSDC